MPKDPCPALLPTPVTRGGHTLRRTVRIEGAVLAAVVAVTALLVGAAS